MFFLATLCSLLTYAKNPPIKKNVSTKTSTAPTYCIPNVSDPEAITLVKFGTINNRTVATSTSGYEDFTSMNTSIGLYKTYEIRLQANTEGNYLASFTVFIDFNQDGVFGSTRYDDKEGGLERFDIGYIQNSNGNDGKEIVAKITVPASAKLGSTRMRVMKRQTTAIPIKFATTGCVLGNTYGQIEDYSVTIFEPTGCSSATNGSNLASFFVPKNNNNQQLITSSAKTGAYTEVLVTEGLTYDFAVDKAGIFSTLSDEKGKTLRTSSDLEFSWASTFTGIIRWYTHTDEAACSSDSTVFSEFIKTTTSKNPITDACSVGIPGSKGYLSIDNVGSTAQEIAFDVPMFPGKFSKIKGMTINLTGNVTVIGFQELNSVNGLPGTVLSTVQASIDSKTLAYTQNGKTFYTYVISFATPILTDGNLGDRKWLKLLTDATASEVSPSYKIGSGVALKNNVSKAWQIDDNRELVYKLDADCTQEMCSQIVISTNKIGTGLEGDLAPFVFNQFSNFIDILVDPGKQLKVNGIELDLWSLHEINNVDDTKVIEFNLYGNDAATDSPSTVVLPKIPFKVTRVKVDDVYESSIPTSVLTRYKVAVQFDQSLSLDAAIYSRYWLEIDSDYTAASAESNSSAFVGKPSYYNFISYGLISPSDTEIVYKLITDCSTLGTQNPTKYEKAKLYPVPFSSTLTVSAPVLIKNIEIYTIAGQKILQKEVNQSKVELNLEGLPVGMYVVRTVDVEGKIDSQKVIKK